jgi:hypothetical protein
MNDRFKFRAWHKEKQEMHNIEGLYAYDSEYTEGGEVFFEEDSSPKNSYYFPEEVELMQSTGLKDKNGKLIYEGDILGGIYENLDIFYCPQCMQFELHAKGYGCMCCNGDIHWCEVVEDNNKLEVIGNIYENKELLNEK